MRSKYISIILLLALLLANSASATTCIIYVLDEYKMTVNGAKIYVDGGAQPIGITTYNTGVGRNCWIGDLDLSGEHTLTAKWARAKPSGIPYEGSLVVTFAGENKMRIRIPTQKI